MYRLIAVFLFVVVLLIFVVLITGSAGEDIWARLGRAADLTTVVGIVFTALGFGLTWQVANEARKSASLATSEVLKLREAVRNIRAIEDLSTTVRLLEDLKNSHRLGGANGWRSALHLYHEARSLIVRMRGDLNILSPAHQEAFTAVLVELSRMEQEVDQSLLDDNLRQELDYASYNSSIQRFVDVLNEILVRLRQQMGA